MCFGRGGWGVLPFGEVTTGELGPGAIGTGSETRSVLKKPVGGSFDLAGLLSNSASGACNRGCWGQKVGLVSQTGPQAA